MITPKEAADRLAAIYSEAIRGPVGWQTAKIEIDHDLFMASLQPAGMVPSVTVKDMVEQNTRGVTFICRGAADKEGATDNRPWVRPVPGPGRID